MPSFINSALKQVACYCLCWHSLDSTNITRKQTLHIHHKNLYPHIPHIKHSPHSNHSYLLIINFWNRPVKFVPVITTE